uniref:Chromosome condensation regulator repeat protein n=1 Tax=Neospora caninum (strain Liverpool) TaxID=572307 RepID=A0A0F7U8C1_NEOCL|nr:TPA: hypothetical protein BN1204_011670 [Neospora caninum Liverpool]
MPRRGHRGRSPQIRLSHCQRGARENEASPETGQNYQGTVSNKEKLGCSAFPLLCPVRRPPHDFRCAAFASVEGGHDVGSSELLFACLQQLQLPDCLHLIHHHGADPFHQPQYYSDATARSLFRILPKGLISDHCDWECPSSSGHIFRHQTRPSSIQLASHLSALLRSPPRKNLAEPYMERCFLVKSLGDNSIFPPSSSATTTDISLFRCLYTWGASSSHQLGYLLFSSAAEKRTHPPRPVHFSLNVGSPEPFESRDVSFSTRGDTSDPLSSGPQLDSPPCPSANPSSPSLSGASYQLSVPSLSPVCSACKARAQNEASSLRVQLIRCGASISLAATFDGEVWVWGKGADGSHQLLSEPTLLRGLDGPLEAFSSPLHLRPPSRGNRSETCERSPHDLWKRCSLHGGEGRPKVIPKAGDVCCRCGSTFLDDAGEKHTRGRIIRGAAVGASHCLLLVDVAVAERPGPNPDEAFVWCGRRDPSAPNNRGSASGEGNEEAVHTLQPPERGAQSSRRRREAKRHAHVNPLCQRGRKGSTNRRAYPGGGPLSPELGPLSFDALRSSGPSSGSSSEVERVDVEAPKATQEADGDGDGWVYRTERRLYAWGDNSRNQLGFCSSRRLLPVHTEGRRRFHEQTSRSSAGGFGSLDGGEPGLASHTPLPAGSAASEDSEDSMSTPHRGNRSRFVRGKGYGVGGGCAVAAEPASPGKPREQKVSKRRLGGAASQATSSHRARPGETDEHLTFRPILLCSWESPPLSNLLSQPESSSPGASPHADLSSFADLGAFLPETGIERKREEDGLGCRRRQKPFGSASAPRKRSFGGRWQSSPRPLPVFPTTWKVEVVAAGLTHSLLLLDDGRVCVFGDNAFGQCAQPPSVARVKSALVLTNLPPCTAISAGQNTNMAVSQPPQKVFVWGGSPVAGPRVSSAPSAAVSHAVAPSSSSSGASSAPTCAACGRNAQAALPFFSPMRLKGVGRREEEPAVTNDGWTMKTTPQGCPLFSTDTLAINDSAGLAVGADERLYIFHCGVRPPIVSRAVPLLFSSDVSAPLSSPHPGPPASPSRGAPALPVLPSAPNAPASTPPSYLHLPQPRTASSPPGGVRQLSLSSSQIFLLTADGLLYSAPIPDASTFTSRPTGKEDEPSRPRGCSSFPPADPKQETLGKRRTPSVSSASSSWSFPSSSSLSPFVLSPSIPEPAELPSGQALCLPPSARPGSSSQQTPGSSRGLPSGFSARQSPACSPADMGCMQASHVEGDGDHATRALGSRRRDRPDTAPGLPGDGSLTSPAPSSVCLHFSPVRQAGSIGAFACSETHTAVIVEIHSPQFRPYTRPPLRSSRGVRQICAAIRASSREVRRRAKHDNVAPVPAFSSDDSLPSSSLSSPRYPAVSPHLPPSLASCAAQALLRPKRPFPATVGHVLETVVPLAVSLGDKSLFDYCCLFLLFNLPLLFLAFHHAKMPSPVSGCTAGPLRSLDIPSLFQTLGSAKRPRPFGSESSSSAASSASCGNGDAFVLAVAGMQYLLRSYKAAVTTAYLRSGTNRNLPLNQQTCLDTLNTLWAHDHDVPGRYTQTRRGNQGSPSVFSSLDEWSPRGTAREAGLDSDDDWAEPRHFHPSGTRRAALRSGPHEETTTSRIFSGMRVLPQPQRQRGQLDEQLPNSLGGLPWPNDIPALLWWVVACAQPSQKHRRGISTRPLEPRPSRSAAATIETDRRPLENPARSECEGCLGNTSPRRDHHGRGALGNVAEQREDDIEVEGGRAGTGTTNRLSSTHRQSTTDPFSHVGRSPSSSSTPDASASAAASSVVHGSSADAAALACASPACGDVSDSGFASGRGSGASSSSLIASPSPCAPQARGEDKDDIWSEEGRQAVALWMELLGTSLEDGQSVATLLRASGKDLATNILFRLPRRASDLLTSSGSALPERRLLIDQWSGAFWTNDEEDQDKALGERNSKGERGRRQDEGRRPQPHYMPPAEHRRREATAEGNGTGDRKPTNATEETREESPCEKWGAHAEATQADAGAETEVESYRETATKAQACVEATETRTQGPNDRDADPGRVDRRTKNGSRSALLKEAVEQATGEKVSQLLDDAATSHLQSTGMQGRWTRPLVPGKGSASKTQPAEEAVRPAGSVHHVLPDWRQERRKGPHHDIRCENGCQSMQMSSPSFAVSSPVSPPSSLSLSSASRPVARPTTSSASPAFAASSAGSSAPCGSASTPQLLTESDFPSLSPFVSTGRPPAPRGPGLADAEAGPVCSKLFPPGVAPVSPSLSASPCGGHKTEAANAISRLGNQCRREVDRNTKDERPALLNDGSSAECMVGAPCARDGSRGNRTAFWPAPDEVGLSGVGQPGDVTAWQRVETKRGKKQNSTCGREAADTVQRGGEIRNTIPALQQPSSHHSGNAHQSSSCSVPPVGRGFGVAHDARARDGHESSAGMPPRVKSVAASIAEHRQRFNTDGPPSLRQRSGEVETGARGGEQYPPGRGFALRDFLVVPSAGQRKKRKNGKETRPSEEQTTQDERAYNVATHRLGAWSRGSAVAEPLVAESACVQTDASPVADLAAIMREEELLRQERVLRFQLRQSQELAQHPSSVVRLSGPPSVVVVSRPVATAAAQASGSDPGTGAARSRARDGPVGPGAPRPSRADAASFNRWGREAALRLQGEKGFGASDLTVIQREQFAEQEEDLAKRREEEELQVALRLVREMEERERQQEANFQREIRRAAELERRRIDARQGSARVNRRGHRGASHHPFRQEDAAPARGTDQTPFPSRLRGQGNHRRGQRSNPGKTASAGCEPHQEATQGMPL